MSDSQLYFAYSALLDPDRMASISPNARFLFTAHYPETRLAFSSHGGRPMPTLTDDPGHIVWGGVFEIPADDLGKLMEAEKDEGRVPGWEMKAVDREGNKHECLTFVTSEPLNGYEKPDPDYLSAMISGARHWHLPAGWVVGLEDLADEDLFI